MCYYVLTGCLTLSAYTASGNINTSETFQTYFRCQSVGIQSGRDCGESPDRKAQGEYGTFVIFFLQFLLPLVILIFIVNCSCKKSERTLSISKSHATTTEQFL